MLREGKEMVVVRSTHADETIVKPKTLHLRVPRAAKMNIGSEKSNEPNGEFSSYALVAILGRFDGFC